MAHLMNLFEEALMNLDSVASWKILKQEQGASSALNVIDALIVPALERVGDGWARGDVSLAQVYMSGRICEQMVDALLPPGATDRKGQPVMAIAVLEDFHLLGKRIVYADLRASGYELIDYGRVTVDELVAQALKDRIEILLISTLMLPSALQVKAVREQLDAAGADIRIVVGGAPFLFDETLWTEVGADAMGACGSDAKKIVDRLAGGTP